MAMTPAERSARAAKKRAAQGVEEIRHPLRPGIKAMLLDLMEWNDTEQAESIDLLIMTAHAAGPEGSAKHMAVPRHEIVISEDVAEYFHAKSLMLIQRDPGDEVVRPSSLRAVI